MLTSAKVQAFFDDGFVVVPGVFGARDVRRMSAAFGRLARVAQSLGATAEWNGSQFVLEPVDGRVRIHRIVWCGAAEPVLSEYGSDPRLLGLAAALLGSSELIQIINQAHFKQPHDGVAFPWHQDSAHRRYGTAEWVDVNGRGSYVQTLVAIDPMSADNGPLELIPGSGVVGHAGLPEGQLPPGIDATRAVAATLAPGDVLLFGPFTFHRSLPNESARPRRVFINGFALPGANARLYPGAGAGRPVRASHA